MSNLAVRTHFSLGQSVLKPEQAVETIKSNGYNIIAVCDKNTVASMSEVVKNCEKHELDYIIGSSIPFYEIADEKLKRQKPIFELKFYIQNEIGLKSLFKLLTLSEQPERFHYVPRLQPSDLTEEALEGLVVTTGDMNSLMRYSKAETVLQQLIKNAPSRVFGEICPVKQPYFKRINKEVIKLVDKYGIKSIVTRPVLYLKGKADTRDMADAIINRNDFTAIWANKTFTRTFHPLSKDMFTQLIAKYDLEQYHNEDEFVGMFSYKWKKLEMSLPKLADDEFKQLIHLCKEGWVSRSGKTSFGVGLTSATHDEYNARLKYELTIIKDMGFSAYFLLVHYVTNYSKENDILVGPARGSAAGSLVAFLLGITDVDPLRFGLIFERFLNPDRLDYPDIDLDFMSSRRTEIIEHLIVKFGKDYVACISNYNSFASASALRDVARISQLPPFEYNCSKLVPKTHGNSVDLETAMLEVTDIEKYALKYPRQWAQSVDLQGCARALATHAAGIVVSGEPVINRASVSNRKEHAVVNWDKRAVEDWGLIKLDVLGLSTLDIISIAIKKLKDIGIKLDLWSIPLDDPLTLNIFSTGRTKGVFQFEGGAARSLCRDVAVSGNFHFNDIVAINALNRPGPLDAGLTEKYVKIRQGRLFKEFPHPRTENALEETEGVIIYQEQVMQIARDLSNFTMAEADVLRKAIGKKDPELMRKMTDKFVTGAVDNGMQERDARNLFDQIELFAGYSFNKSHAVAYSLISYMCGYLKAHHSAEFYAASMTILDDEKVKLIAKEASQDGIIVMPPDINISSDVFESSYDDKRGTTVLFSPLTAVKNVSAKVCAHILEVRKEKGKFESYDQFFKAVEARKCNIRAKDNLTKVGAFASIEPTQTDPLDQDRLKDQKELMGALAVSDVKPDRYVDMSPFLQGEIVKLYNEVGANGKEPIAPTFGAKPKMVVITDKPSFFEIAEGNSFKGKSNVYIKRALKLAGLKPSECYFTHLVKTKPDEKELSKEEIDYYGEFLRKELEMLNPSLVILAGTKSIRYFYPEVKGSAEELSGTIEYDKDSDRSFAFTINPQMIYIKPDKQEALNEVFQSIADLLD